VEISLHVRRYGDLVAVRDDSSYDHDQALLTTSRAADMEIAGLFQSSRSWSLNSAW
jgi:hypothetical protein